MPVMVRRRARTQPIKMVRKFSKLGELIRHDKGCSRSTNDGTKHTGASLLNALVLQPCIVREASVVWELMFHLHKSAKVEPCLRGEISFCNLKATRGTFACSKVLRYRRSSF